MDLGRRFDIAAVAIVFLVFLATVYLTKEFLSTILLSVVLVFLLKPVYALLFKITKHGQLSSLLSMMVMMILILVVILGLTGVLLVEISNLAKSGALSEIRFSTISNDLNLWLQSILPGLIYQYIKGIGDIPAAIASYLSPIAERELASFASNVPGLFAQAIVAIFFTYYILIDGSAFVKQAVELLPKTKRSAVHYFLQELNSIYTTLFTVYFTTSVLSGILAAVGFSLLGIPYPLVLGALVAIFTLIPLVGPPFVFVPMAVYYLMLGDLTMSLVLLVFGTLVLMVIPENVIRPHLALKSARIHPIVTVLAYTAPIFVVGVIGVFIGPTLYGFLLAAYRAAAHYREI
jgi:predicted PurR-regulated permease PerM